MTRHHLPEHPGTKRPGKTLAMFVLLTPVLLGMVGLTIDGGLMLVTYRQTQNAADAAALAAAVDLIHGNSIAIASTTGTTYVQTYNNMAGATVTITVPDSGPYSGNSNYAQAIVSYPFQTSFIQVLGVNSSQQVTARAVAGYENVAGQNLVFLVE
jgi:Flp pilus assembly protein TadG